MGFGFSDNPEDHLLMARHRHSHTEQNESNTEERNNVMSDGIAAMCDEFNDSDDLEVCTLSLRSRKRMDRGLWGVGPLNGA